MSSIGMQHLEVNNNRKPERKPSLCRSRSAVLPEAPQTEDRTILKRASKSIRIPVENAWMVHSNSMEHLQHQVYSQASSPSMSSLRTPLRQQVVQQQHEKRQQQQQHTPLDGLPSRSSDSSTESLKASEALATATPSLSSKLQPPRKGFYFSPPTPSYNCRNLPSDVPASPSGSFKQKEVPKTSTTKSTSPGQNWNLAARKVSYLLPWVRVLSILRDRKAIHPKNNWKRVLDGTVLLYVIYELIAISFQLCFRNNPPDYFQRMVDLMFDCLYALHIFITIRTGFYSQPSGDYITDLKSVRIHYVRKWLILELLSFVPLIVSPFAEVRKSSEAVIQWQETCYIHSWSGFLALLRLLRLPRMLNEFVGINSTMNSFVNPNIMRFLQLQLAAFVVGHCIACGWMMIGHLQGFGATSWGPPAELCQKSVGSQYIKAFFWAISNMTGQGGQEPTTDLELCYNLFTIFVGVAFYATLIGNVGSLIQNLDYSAIQYREKMESVNRYMRYRDIPMDLRNRVNNYYHYLWRRQKGMHETEILADLPVSLRTEISMFLNKDIVQKVPFFRGCENGFISVLVTMLRPQVCSPGEYIIRQGDFGREMYFMSKGWIEVLVNGKRVTTLGDGSFFGEMALLSSERRKASIRALTYCDLYYLTKEDMNTILQEFPHFADVIRSTASTRQLELRDFRNFR